MTLFQSILLGLVQGLTEFFPISSSAHLRLTKWLLGMADGEHLLYFDLLCHLGTLLALLIYLRRDVWDILRSPRKMAIYFIALIPLIPAYFLLKPLRVAASDPAYLGYSLMITAGLLFAASRKVTTENTEKKIGLGLAHGLGLECASVAGVQGDSPDSRARVRARARARFSLGSPLEHNPANRFITSAKWKDVLCIGVMQCAALIPGISRSGSTISAARFCGWSWTEAARFSFLLAIPTILGGELLETMKIVKNGWVSDVPAVCYAGGFLASFGLGMLAVRWMFWIYEKEKVAPFAWYCLAAGLFAWVAFRG